MTPESVSAWELEETPHHTVPVPKMSQEERVAWHYLSNDRHRRKLSKGETRLLRALTRKLRRRAAFDRSDL